MATETSNQALTDDVAGLLDNGRRICFEYCADSNRDIGSQATVVVEYSYLVSADLIRSSLRHDGLVVLGSRDGTPSDYVVDIASAACTTRPSEKEVKTKD